MDVLIYFILAIVISFIGSLQPGPVNMAVLYHAVHKRNQTALNVAIGGSLPEALFSFVAFRLLSSISRYIAAINQFSIIIDCALVIIGLVLIFRKQQQHKEATPTSNLGFLSGLLLASFNPQLLIFWVGIITGLSIYTIQIESIYAQLSFSIGTSVGAFILHLLVMLSVRRYQSSRWVDWLKQYSIRLIGTILVGVGLSQLILNIL